MSRLCWTVNWRNATLNSTAWFFLLVNKLLLNARSYSDHNSATEVSNFEVFCLDKTGYSASYLWFSIYREIPVTNSHTVQSCSSFFVLYISFFLKATFESLWFAPRLNLSFHHLRDRPKYRSLIICFESRICEKINKCIQYIYIYIYIHTHTHTHTYMHAVAQLIEALRYKTEGRGFDYRWWQWNFSLT